MIARSEETVSNTTSSDQSALSGFGSANFFSPMASDGTVVAAHCQWQLRYNVVENRIPRRFLPVELIELNARSLFAPTFLWSNHFFKDFSSSSVDNS